MALCSLGLFRTDFASAEASVGVSAESSAEGFAEASGSGCLPTLFGSGNLFIRSVLTINPGAEMC